MRGKIAYLLVILLFLTVGALCRSRAVSMQGASVTATLSQRTIPEDRDAGRYLNHSFLAPENLSQVPASRPDYKAPVRNPIVPDAYLSAIPAVVASAALAFVDLHPDRVGYYVFSLEKIRI